ncbi:MAG TPA: extracellular solute-binding protein [Solirubrobacteraceae bacterium]|nr:extracellular solute-binding protein [Solirubrobacteraceae bacterium]
MQGARRGLTRREALIGGTALGAAAALGIATTGSPFGGATQTVTFWHLFGGGDGERLTEILADIDAENPDSDVRQLILQWGNPYYTKLALAAVGGSPPDVAVVHATRLPSFAPAGLLEELTPELLAPHGLTEDQFLEKPWKSCQSGGRQYAIPLDTHPFVLYYNTDLVEQAGLLGGDGKLRPLDGPSALLDACEAVKEETGKTGLVFETRGVTPWRVFLTLYTQLGGPPILEEGGSRIGLDDETAIQALEWMAQPNARGVGGPDVDYQGSVAFFSNQSAAFALNGEWEVTTYQAMDLPFGMRTVPTIFDRPATQADSHTFVIPRDPDRSPERLDAALAFISRLINKGLDWAKGGHVPAYRKIFESDAYRELTPQSDYAAAVDDLVFDPLAWYSGSGSNLEYNAGSALSPVVTGTLRPEQGLRTFRDYLDRMSKTPKPV